MCATFAVILWDLIGQSRLPHRIARGLVGFIFAFGALALVATVSGSERRDFTINAIAVFLGALTVDALIGDTIRAGIGLRR